LIATDKLDFPGSIFYQPDFLITASEILNLDFQPYVCFASDILTGMANILLGGKFNIRTAIIPTFFQYYGPISLPEDKAVLKYLYESIQNDVDTAVFSLTPEESLKFNLSDWQKKNRLTYYLIPDTFENMISKCSRNVKRNVKKARQAEVDIKTTDALPYDLYEASFNRNGLKPPLGESKTVGWVERLTKLNIAKTYIAVVDNQPAAFRTQLIWGKYAYDWLAGAKTSCLNLGVNHFLVLKIGEKLYHKGIKNWDLLGGDIESIGSFKKSFGSIPKKHVEIERNFSLKGTTYRYLMKLKARRND